MAELTVNMALLLLCHEKLTYYSMTLRSFTVIVWLAVSTSSFAQSMKELISAGDQQYGKKNYAGALATYLKAHQINPDDASVNFKIGLSYLYSDTKSKAAAYIASPFFAV